MELHKLMAVEIHVEGVAYSTKSDTEFAQAFGLEEQGLRHALVATQISTSFITNHIR